MSGLPIVVRRMLSGIGVFTALLLSNPVRAAAPPNYKWFPSGLDGCGGQGAVAADPLTPGTIIAGGDIWGIYKSTNYGRSWQGVTITDPSAGNQIFPGTPRLRVACIRYSLRTPNRVFAGTGDTGNGGGFLRSENGGDTWVLASSQPTFGAQGGTPRDGEAGHPRSVGNLIMLDPNLSDADGGGEFIYVGTCKNGVMRSHNAGGNWASIALPGQSPAYMRGMAIDDADPTLVYAGCYDKDNDGTNEAVYRIANARTATSGELIPNTPFLYAEEMVVVHGILYVAAGKAGVFKYEPAKPADQAWSKVYDDGVSEFYSIDGFWDASTSQAVIYAGTTDIAKAVGKGNLYYSLIRSKDSGASWKCLTSDPVKIHPSMPMGDAAGDIWWHSVGSVSACLGGGTFVACQTLVDPSDPTHKRVYVCGRAGMWRSDDALTIDNPTWYPAVRYLNSTVNWGVAADPNVSGRACTIDMDWTFQYSTDFMDHVTQKTGLPGGDKEYCIDCDSTLNPGVVSPVYMGRNGFLCYNANPSTSNWVDTKLPSTNNVHAVTAKTTPKGKVVMAAVENSGIWRKIGGGATGDWGTSPVFSANNILRGLDGSDQTSVFSWAAGDSEMVYFTDRENGVFRSMDSGETWMKIPDAAGILTAKGAGNVLRASGSVTVDPTNSNNCYVTSAKGIAFSSNAADPTPSFAAVTIPGKGSGTPGWAVYDDEGNIYINIIANAGNLPKLFYKAKGDTTWYNIGGTDPTFISLNSCDARKMAVGPKPDHAIYMSHQDTGVCVARIQKPAEPLSYVTDYFDRGAFVKIDEAGPDTEVIRQSASSVGGALSSKFNWGGFHNGTAGTIAFGINGALQFNTNTVAAGSRAYTKFDTSANTEAATATTQFTNPSTIIDCTNGTWVLDMMSQTQAGLKLALLLRDDAQWWESNSLNVPTGAGQYDFALNAMTWTKVDKTSGGGMDMDEVDHKGETSLSYLEAGTPNLVEVQGMGVIVKAPATVQTGGAFQIDSMQLGVVPRPSLLTANVMDSPSTGIRLDWQAAAGAGGYYVYRATSSGGPYTKLNTSALSASTLTYNDTTVAVGTSFYYVVRGIYPSSGANNPAYSAQSPEASAVITPESAAQRWIRFR